MAEKSGGFPRLGLFSHSSNMLFTEDQSQLDISFRERGLLKELETNEKFDLDQLCAKAGNRLNEIKKSTNKALTNDDKITIKEYAILYDLAKLFPHAAKTATEAFPHLPNQIKTCHDIVGFFNKNPQLLSKLVTAQPPQLIETPRFK